MPCGVAFTNETKLKLKHKVNKGVTEDLDILNPESPKNGFYPHKEGDFWQNQKTFLSLFRRKTKLSRANSQRQRCPAPPKTSCCCLPTSHSQDWGGGVSSSLGCLLEEAESSKQLSSLWLPKKNIYIYPWTVDRMGPPRHYPIRSSPPQSHLLSIWLASEQCRLCPHPESDITQLFDSLSLFLHSGICIHKYSVSTCWCDVVLASE